MKDQAQATVGDISGQDGAAARVMVVDDEAVIRDTTRQFLEKEGYEVAMAADGPEAIGLLEQREFHVVVSDIVMPGMTGIELLHRIQEISPETKTILFTGEPTIETAAEAVRNGATDYLSKPVKRDELCRTVANALKIRSLEDLNRQYLETLEIKVRERTEKLRKTLSSTIRVLCDTVEVRDPYTAGHQNRVSGLAAAIALDMGLDQDEVEAVRMASSVHDLGKIAVPAEILAKPGKITTGEYELIKRHSQVGYELLKNVEFDWPVADIVHQHHEKLDGSGYPRGLQGDEIRVEATIIAVADVVEAMASHRPYRAALGIDCALSEISRQKGKHFAPEAVASCLKVFDNGFAFESGNH